MVHHDISVNINRMIHKKIFNYCSLIKNAEILLNTFNYNFIGSDMAVFKCSSYSVQPMDLVY